jgi:hypothetical protein
LVCVFVGGGIHSWATSRVVTERKQASLPGGVMPAACIVGRTVGFVPLLVHAVGRDQGGAVVSIPSALVKVTHLQK